MGWLWSSSSPAASPAATTEKSASPTSQSTVETPIAPPAASKPLTSDELADQDLQSFLKEIDADIQPSSKKYNRIPRGLPSGASSKPSTTQSIASQLTDENAPLSEQLLPTTMSCRTAFDAAFYCNSFGGRFNDLYRYGTLKSCSETWGDFWFCMRTRTQSSPSKELAIREHYRQKESMKYSKELGRESSEDVWKTREKKMEWGEAFNVEFEEFKGSDEEWRKAQREWRARERVDGTVGKEGGS